MNNEMNILQLIYISHATQKLSEQDLNKILAEARPSNESRNITGMLLYRDGLFIQVLEGEEAVIEQLLSNIKKDTRHHDVHVVSKQIVKHREFSDWSMGFKNISHDMEGANSFLESTKEPIDNTLQPSTARKLLATFRDMR